MQFEVSNCKYAKPICIFHRIASGAGLFRAGDHGAAPVWQDDVGATLFADFDPQGKQFMIVEIKSGSTFSGDWTVALRKLSALFGDAALPPGIVCGGEGQYERGGCRVVGWEALAQSLDSAMQ